MLLYLFASNIFLSDFDNREQNNEQAVHIINIDIQDNHEEATIGAFMICELVTMVNDCCHASVQELPFLTHSCVS